MATAEAAQRDRRTGPTHGAARGSQTGVLVACTVGNFVSLTPAVTAVFSLFLVPISHEFAWPRATVSGVLALIAFIGAAVYPIAGRLADRFGARRVILFGQFLFAPSIAALALANGSVWQFYFLFGLVGLTGSIPTTAAYSKIISEWFDKRRGMMLGVAAGLGNGVGATVMPIIAGMMMLHFGWRRTYVGIAAIVFVFGFPLLWALLRDRPSRPTADGAPEAPSAGHTVVGAMRTSTFWLILVAIALGAGCVTAVFTHVVPILTDRGFSVTIATEVLSAFALVCSVWQIVVGRLLDWTGSPRVVVPMYLAAIAGLALVCVARTPVGVIAGGALLGIGLGAEFGALPYILSRYFGLRAYAGIAGVMYAVVSLTQGITPFLMDASFDRAGSYRPSAYAVAAFLLVASGLLLLLPRMRSQPAAAERDVPSTA